MRTECFGIRKLSELGLRPPKSVLGKCQLFWTEGVEQTSKNNDALAVMIRRSLKVKPVFNCRLQFNKVSDEQKKKQLYVIIKRAGLVGKGHEFGVCTPWLVSVIRL